MLISQAEQMIKIITLTWIDLGRTTWNRNEHRGTRRSRSGAIREEDVIAKVAARKQNPPSLLILRHKPNALVQALAAVRRG